MWSYVFWCDILLGKGFLKTKKQICKVILASSYFLLFFVPVDIDIAGKFRDIVNGGLIYVMFFMDDNDSGNKDKKENNKVNPKKLRWLPNV